MAAPKKVIADPMVISFVITGPTFFISLLFRVSPPSNKIMLIARRQNKKALRREIILFHHSI